MLNQHLLKHTGQMGQVENNARYLRQLGYRIVEDIDVSQSDFQTLLDELTAAKNSLVQHNGCMPSQAICLKRTLTYPIWFLRVDAEGLQRCATGVEWRRLRQRRMRRSERVSLGDQDPCKETTCLEILCITGEQELVCIKHQLGSLELKEEMSGYLIVRQLSSVQNNSYVWHHPRNEKCERC